MQQRQPAGRLDHAAERPATDTPDGLEHRQIVYRVLCCSTVRRPPGACRLVRNEMPDQQAQLVDVARMCGARPPAPRFFMLGKASTQLRRVTPWLQAMPSVPVRSTLKHQADAWQRFFPGEAGRFRIKRRGRDSMTVPQDVRIRGDRLRRSGGNPEPVRATLKRVNGTWMAVVCDTIAAAERPDDGTVTGVGMNVGQIAVSDGRCARILHAPDLRRLEAKIRRERTRQRLARTQRRLAMRRRNWHRHVSHGLASAAPGLEAAQTRAMTASVKGTVEAPGQNVRQKAGLNRVILATGWSGLRAMFEYKAPRLIAVDLRHTRQTCTACGQTHAASRRSPARRVRTQAAPTAREMDRRLAA